MHWSSSQWSQCINTLKEPDMLNICGVLTWEYSRHLVSCSRADPPLESPPGWGAAEFVLWEGDSQLKEPPQKDTASPAKAWGERMVSYSRSPGTFWSGLKKKKKHGIIYWHIEKAFEIWTFKARRPGISAHDITNRWN